MKCTTHRRPLRQPEAVKRQEAWAALSPTEKIAALDERLGKGIGAARQRKRIAEQSSAPKRAAAAPAAAEVAEPTTKKVKAKERRAAEKAAADEPA